jgi:sugar/nucleoside kinase (ribokinase family)
LEERPAPCLCELGSACGAAPQWVECGRCVLHTTMALGGPAQYGQVRLLGVQSSGMVDHIIRAPSNFIAAHAGGQQQHKLVSQEELLNLLQAADARDLDVVHLSGGGAANTLRALFDGFGVSCGIVGAVGGDVWGQRYTSSFAGRVDTTRLVTHPEQRTARCCVLVDDVTGERVLRTDAGVGCAALTQLDLPPEALAGTPWVYVTGYALYTPGLLEAVLALAQTHACKLVLQLASADVVRTFFPMLRQLLLVDSVFDAIIANEEEALAYLDCERRAQGVQPPGAELHSEVLAALDLLAVASRGAVCVITLGDRGCIMRVGADVIQQDAVHVPPQEVVDTCAAGDFFAAGFLAGLVSGAPHVHSARFGCLAGAAAVRTLGGESSPEVWDWAGNHLQEAGLSHQNWPPSSQQDSCPEWYHAEGASQGATPAWNEAGLVGAASQL